MAVLSAQELLRLKAKIENLEKLTKCENLTFSGKIGLLKEVLILKQIMEAENDIIPLFLSHER
jgi:hypothetical protein